MKKYLCKKESGAGGISYGMYLIAVVTTIFMFVFLKYEADLLIIESDLENGLSVIESGALSLNNDVKPVIAADDDVKNELIRAYIVSSVNTSSAVSSDELAEITVVGKYLSETMRTEFDLSGSEAEGYIHPSSGILKEICGEDGEITITEASITQPIYRRSFQIADDNSSITDLKAITGYVQYVLLFENNNFIGVKSKTYYGSAAAVPMKKSKDTIKGATIEMTIGAKLIGYRNVFAGVNRVTPTMTNGNITASNVSNKYMFGKKSTVTIYDITVTEAADVIVTGLDARVSYGH